MHYRLLVLAISVFALSCDRTPLPAGEMPAVTSVFGDKVPFDPPLSYASNAPDYILKDQRLGEDVDDRLATLGRVLFYDTLLSLNNSIACASCHQRAHGFGDPTAQSTGLDGGRTSRQSMRLVNIRYGSDLRMFWDERAADLNDQVTQPIQDHIEMGFSGAGDQPNIDSLERKLATVSYYQELFTWAFDANTAITETEIAKALEAFVFSIESFDSRFDQGRADAPGNAAPFSNFTDSENRGKTLFIDPPQIGLQGVRTGGGAGCAGCHRPPEFDIAPNSGNNGVDHEAGNPAGFDTTNTRSPSLRDVLNAQGQPHTPMMHTGDFIEFTTVLEHYNEVIPDVNNVTVDPKLVRGNNRVQLELTSTEREDLENFIKTLTGANLYVDKRWSDPFE